MRAFIFVDNEKAVAQMIDDLFQYTRKSMKVMEDGDDVLCGSEKTLRLYSFHHPFHFDLVFRCLPRWEFFWPPPKLKREENVLVSPQHP